MKIEPEIAGINRSEAFIRHALEEYDREQISLGRLAELLGVDRLTAGEFVESRGMHLRQGPANLEEALAEIRAAERLSDD